MMCLNVMTEVLTLGTLTKKGGLLDSFIHLWNKNACDLVFIRASSNFIYRFNIGGIPYILRLTDMCKKRQDVIEREIAYLDYLSSSHLVVNTAVKSRFNQYIHVLDTPVGKFYGVVFNCFKGIIYEIDEINKQQYTLWGQALGEVHVQSKSHILKGVETLNGRLDKYVHLNNSIDDVIYSEYRCIMQFLNTLDKTQHYGMIHFDFELDNLIFKDNTVQIIDFEDMALGWYMADIAFALRDLFEEGVDVSHPMFCAFIDGYKSEHSVNDKDLEQLSMFLRYRELLAYFEIKQTLRLFKKSSKNQPEWVNKIANKLYLKLACYKNKCMAPSN